MARRLRWSFLFAFLFGIGLFFLFFFYGVWAWLFTLLSIVLAAWVVFLVYVYYARLGAAEGFFDKANEPKVTFFFTENGVQTRSDLGSSDLKWQVFDEILKFRKVWLLVYAKSGYMTLPIDQMPAECLDLIDSKIGQT